MRIHGAWAVLGAVLALGLTPNGRSARAEGDGAPAPQDGVLVAQALEELDALDQFKETKDASAASGAAEQGPGAPAGGVEGHAGPGGSGTAQPAPAASEGGTPLSGQAARTSPAHRRDPNVVFSMGMHLGQPLGLQFQTRLWKRHALVGTLGYDFIFSGFNVQADYRFTIYELELLRYEASVGFWVGAGMRLGALEPYRSYQRTFFGFGLGGRIPAGLTLRLRPLPVELSGYVSPIGFDFNGLTRPRWRPEAAVELKVDFPWSPL